MPLLWRIWCPFVVHKLLDISANIQYCHVMPEVVPFLIDAYNQMEGNVRHLVEPKQIPTPAGYHPTKCVAASLFATMTQAVMAGQSGVIPASLERSVFGMTYRIINEGVPIFFVSTAFAEAVAATEFPSDLMLNDLKWPFDGMVLGFPTEFMNRYVGREVCYVHATFIPAGFIRSPILGAPTIETPKEKIGIRFLTNSESPGRLSNLVTVYHTDEPIQGVFERYTYTDYTGSLNPSQIQNDEECLSKVVALVLKLLIIVSIKPDFMTLGTETRPRSEKKGRVRNALWSPNWIGEKYVTKVSQGGTHASPRIHRVKGHLHWYLSGPGRTIRTRKWTEPYWKGLD